MERILLELLFVELIESVGDLCLHLLIRIDIHSQFQGVFEISETPSVNEHNEWNKIVIRRILEYYDIVKHRSALLWCRNLQMIEIEDYSFYTHKHIFFIFVKLFKYVCPC